MLNLAAFRGSNGRIDSYGSYYANSGSVAASTSQMTALEVRPSVFWDGRRFDYASLGSSGTFLNQNSSIFYSIWRLTDNSDIITDIASGEIGSMIRQNNDISWDDQLFVVNGQGKGNTTNGSSLSKVVVSTNYADFSISQPLLMSLTGGLPRGGGDVVSKNEPGDAWYRAGDFDYYLNYYPKYDGTAKKLLAKDDGYDWFGLQSRTQIDGTKPLPAISASAESSAGGYSKVGQ